VMEDIADQAMAGWRRTGHNGGGADPGIAGKHRPRAVEPLPTLPPRGSASDPASPCRCAGRPARSAPDGPSWGAFEARCRSLSERARTLDERGRQACDASVNPSCPGRQRP
jgi:hypothetical protein